MGVAAAAGVLVSVAGVLVSVAGVLVPDVDAVTEGLPPQPVKSKKSRRQGTVQKRFRGMVKIESFKGAERRDFMVRLGQSVRARACTLPISKLLD
jgi:hypothetical protein